MPGKIRSGLRGRGAAAVLTLVAAVSLVLALGLLTAAGSSKRHAIKGTRHADHLVGTHGADVIKGGGGFDHINGRGGADTLLGGAGGAVLVGGLGRDEFNSIGGEPVDGQGRDVIRARDGTRDVIN